MRVTVSAVLAEVASGRRQLITASSRSAQFSSSLFSPRAEDQKHIADLKQDAFAKLLTMLPENIR